MAKPKIRISAGEILRDIRAGASDLMLMNKYGLSARNLGKLFERLVAEGGIEREEIDRRIFDPARSHAVELGPRPERTPKKAVVRTADPVADIRAGMTDTDLMEKYNLSSRGLDSLFSKLVEAGAIRGDELEHRKASMQWAELAFADDVEGETDQHGQWKGRGPGLPRRAVRFVSRHKTLAAALGGVFIGWMAAVCLFYMAYGLPPGFGEGRWVPETRLEKTLLSLQRQAADLIRVLEAVIGETATVSEPSPYQDCLEKCDRAYPDPGDIPSVERLNCKKKCLSKYSEEVRRIRARFYEGNRE